MKLLASSNGDITALKKKNFAKAKEGRPCKVYGLYVVEVLDG
jgi:hypothetical protein